MGTDGQFQTDFRTREDTAVPAEQPNLTMTYTAP